MHSIVIAFYYLQEKRMKEPLFAHFISFDFGVDCESVLESFGVQFEHSLKTVGVLFSFLFFLFFLT